MSKQCTYKVLISMRSVAVGFSTLLSNRKSFTVRYECNILTVGVILHGFLHDMLCSILFFPPPFRPLVIS
jgi:hypothetical protein